MAKTNRDKKTVPLGSGRFYLSKFDGTAMPKAEALAALCVDENLLGETKGGATLTYTYSEHKEQDDHGKLMRIVMVDEEAKLKGGIFSWFAETLTKLVRTGRMSTEGKYNVLKIGGLDNDNGEQYIVIFKHIDPKYPPLYVAIVGANSAGLSIAFARDNTSKLEPEFTALPCDDEGSLIYILEEKVEEAAAAQSDNGGDPAAQGATTE